MPERDQRKTFRCPADETRRQCELVVGDLRIPAILMDESAGGFSILVDQPVPVVVHEKVELGTVSGWFRVRVVHLQEVAPVRDDDDDNASSEEDHRQYRLGLRRLQELEAPTEPTQMRSPRSLRFTMSHYLSPGNFTVVLGMFLAVGLIAAFVVGKRMFWPEPRNARPAAGVTPAAAFHDDASSPMPLPRKKPHSSSADSPRARTNRIPTVAETFDAANPFAGATRTTAGAQHANKAADALHDTMRRLPGAMPLLLPEVVERLELTEEQQTAIQQAVDAGAWTVREIAAELRGGDRQEAAKLQERALEESRKKALKCLTEEQLAEWHKLMEQQNSAAEQAGSQN